MFERLGGGRIYRTHGQVKGCNHFANFLYAYHFSIHVFFCICSQNRPLPARPLGVQNGEIVVPDQFDIDIVLKISEVLGNAKAEWTLRHLLDGASLLAKCCQVTKKISIKSTDCKLIDVGIKFLYQTLQSAIYSIQGIF